MAGAPQPQLASEHPARSLPQLHMGMMPSKRLKGNPDPSRAPGSDVRGTAADGRGDPVGPRNFADSGDWPSDADGGGPAAGKPGCNSAAHDHSMCTRKTSRRIRRHDKTAAAELLPHAPPYILTGGAGQRPRLRGRLELLDCGDLTKVAMRNPAAPTAGFRSASRLRSHIN